MRYWGEEIVLPVNTRVLNVRKCDSPLIAQSAFLRGPAHAPPGFESKNQTAWG